jgi:hypothetical protein
MEYGQTGIIGKGRIHDIVIISGSTNTGIRIKSGQNRVGIGLLSTQLLHQYQLKYPTKNSFHIILD